MCRDFLGWLCIADNSKHNNIMSGNLKAPHSCTQEKNINHITIPTTQKMEKAPSLLYVNLGGTSPVSIKPYSPSNSASTISDVPPSPSSSSKHYLESESEDYSSEGDYPEVPGFTLKKRKGAQSL